MMTIEEAKKVKLPEEYGMAGYDHLPESEDIYDFISAVDFVNGDCFCFKSGGDGDNGEILKFLLDAYLEDKYRRVYQ